MNVSQLSPESSPPSSGAIGPGRPKTGHTIIERRYRTNLNARITNLKQSVPALRVLEARLNGKDTSPNDTVDERGFVDGVKVGRKMSKANILGKATEYIRFVSMISYSNLPNNPLRRVLKRREARLKREQAGLKSLVSGLGNGSALLEAWETQWREMFGGEEKDEVEDEPGSDEEDVDVDGEAEEDEEDSVRAKKRARTVKTVKATKVPSVLPATPKPTTVTTTPMVLSEKRKRGRPRKIPLPIPAPQVTATIPVTINPAPQSPQQYLLAAFAFLSFLNSPLTTSSAPYSHPHEHTGSVLNHTVAGKPSEYGWDDLIQSFHLLVSAALFFSIVVPWLPQALRNSRLIAKLASPFVVIYPTCGVVTLSATSAALEDSQAAKRPSANVDASRSALLKALSPASRGLDTEAQMLRKALGISVGLVGLCQGVSKAGRKHRGIELDQLEQRAWVRLGELVALDGTYILITDSPNTLISYRYRLAYYSVTDVLGDVLAYFHILGICGGSRYTRPDYPPCFWFPGFIPVGTGQKKGNLEAIRETCVGFHGYLRSRTSSAKMVSNEPPAGTSFSPRNPWRNPRPSKDQETRATALRPVR